MGQSTLVQILGRSGGPLSTALGIMARNETSLMAGILNAKIDRRRLRSDGLSRYFSLDVM